MTDLTIIGLGGTNVVLKKINQDAYSGEYFKRVSNVEYRVKVRHTNENIKSGALPMVRHNVDVMVTTYSADGLPPEVYQAYFVLRHPLAGDDTAAGNIASNLVAFLGSNDLPRIIGWETDLTAAE